jgi:hypothetical protein
MDDVQKQHERAAGDKFISWYNNQTGSNFNFASRGDLGPDLIYKDQSIILKIEIVDCYYDNNDAKVKWMNVRHIPNAPRGWGGVNFDYALLKDINRAIKDKCVNKSYGSDCIILVNISPSLTTANEIEDMLSLIEIPKGVPVDAIYLSGTFPISRNSIGGYRVWQLYGKHQ